MAVGGGRRYADPAGGLAQSNRLHAALVQNLPGRGHKRGRQIAMTIRTYGTHSEVAYRAVFTMSTRGAG